MKAAHFGRRYREDHEPEFADAPGQPAAVEDDGVRRVSLVDEECVLERLHHREVALVEEKPRRLKYAIRFHDAYHFIEVVLGLCRIQVCEDGPRLDQGERRVRCGKWEHALLRLGIETRIEDVVVHELESRRDGSQIRLTPLDHSRVEIYTQVMARLRALLDQASSEPSAAATEVEDCVVC